MKKTLFSALALAAATGANVCMAQVAEEPRTTVSVSVSVQTQTIRTGPYARFAQRYLGVLAPLSDKQLITVTGASIGFYDDSKQPAPAAPAAEQPSGLQPLSHTRNALEFVKVPVDRRDFTARTPEEAAREAASSIFSLRKARIELITGMAGENVFGAGLPSALAEIDRLEEEYLALFMGKQSVDRVTKIYSFIPGKEETSRIVCRISNEGGLVPADDLSGSPIVLEMKPLNPAAPPAVVAKPARNAPPTVRRYEPGMVDCRLVEGKNELAQARIPVYQMGAAVDVPVASGR